MNRLDQAAVEFHAASEALDFVRECFESVATEFEYWDRRVARHREPAGSDLIELNSCVFRLGVAIDCLDESKRKRHHAIAMLKSAALEAAPYLVAE